MNLPDIWSLVTGAASIVSLLLSLPEKYSNWRKYTLPTAYFLAGWTIHSLSSEFSQSVHEAFQDPYLAIIFLVVFAFLGLSVYVFSVLVRTGYVFHGYLIISIIVSSGITPIFNIYSQINPAIPTQDYLEFAMLKEQKDDLTSAIQYYQKYIQRVDDKDSKKLAQQKISTLRARQFNQVNQR
ncbi:hypothetical protein C7Y66_14385 [Chroococcidiopsis sp. CCALA 051]|uniref:hypothetical protein n=1 Tax=Chroococcidiopsis sp. CCALA 051 TaxID=869949 RepID=UPI000D0E1B20|nr:hypothetical protein [Chroococcidiopsis sp. CCALA 051]PSM48495.1 hypothetical protein C7Y66_14385 [Chroococcidiopsis sp. CCALA 051]